MAAATQDSGQRGEGELQIFRRKEGVIAPTFVNKVSVSVSVRSYELNKLQFIEKKLLACRRPVYEVDRGLDQNKVNQCH